MSKYLVRDNFSSLFSQTYHIKDLFYTQGLLPVIYIININYSISYSQGNILIVVGGTYGIFRDINAILRRTQSKVCLLYTSRSRRTVVGLTVVLIWLARVLLWRPSRWYRLRTYLYVYFIYILHHLIFNNIKYLVLFYNFLRHLVSLKKQGQCVLCCRHCVVNYELFYYNN